MPVSGAATPTPVRREWPALVAPAFDLGKATVDNLLDSAAILQSMAEDVVLRAVDGSSWCPNEFKQVAHEAVGFMRRTRKDFRTTLDRTHGLTVAWLERLRGVEAGAAIDSGLLAN
jgi:hypothetical protein